jgi:hypothetical protein
MSWSTTYLIPEKELPEYRKGPFNPQNIIC